MTRRFKVGDRVYVHPHPHIPTFRATVLDPGEEGALLMVVRYDEGMGSGPQGMPQCEQIFELLEERPSGRYRVKFGRQWYTEWFDTLDEAKDFVSWAEVSAVVVIHIESDAGEVA